MHFSSSTVVLASVLLVKGVVAGPRHGHFHKRVLDVITDVDIIYETVTDVVWVTVTGDDGAVTTTTTPAAIAPVQPTSSTVPVVEAVTTDLAPVSTALAPASTIAPVVAAISSVVEAAPSPVVFTSIATPVQVPTTLSTLIAPVSVAAPVTTVVTTPIPVAPTTSSVAAAVTSPVLTSSSSSKRGLSYNDVSNLDPFSGSSLIDWCYNWGSTTQGTIPSNFEFVPMLWGLADEFTSSWSSNAQAAIDSGSKYLLAFNEPDNSGQSNISPADAAQGYQTYMNPFSGSAQLGAPAVTNGGSPEGLTWLEDFISACNGACDIDFVPIHWYDSATNFAYFKQYVQDAYVAGGNRTLWITEFGATGSSDEQATFLEVVMPWLDQQEYVGRYAYFMDSVGVLLDSTSEVSAIGSTFASFSSSTINSLIADV